MRLEQFDNKHGRLVLIGAVLLIWGAIIWSFNTYGYVQTWNLWHIPAKKTPFLDFRLIPGSAETFRSGIDPAISNPNDPSHRLFNYPKIWYWLFSLKISQDDTIWISIVLIVLFFIVLFAFPEKIRIRDALILLVFIFSPACMLLYERGNVDLIFFILCGLTILTASRWPVAASAILLIASFFKLFPFLGIAVFIQENKKRFYALFGAVAAIFFFYLLLNIESLKASWQLTERGIYGSYGAAVIFDLLHAYARYDPLNIAPEGQVQTVMIFIPYFFAFLLLAATLFLAVKNQFPFPTVSERNLGAFRLGAAIYAGTFLLGNNWDYRLAFLLFVIPQLSQWFSASSGKYRWLFLGMFAVMLASCWDTFIFHYVLQLFGEKYKLYLYIFDEVMNWSMFAGLAYLFIASSPAWLRTFSLNPFSTS